MSTTESRPEDLVRLVHRSVLQVAPELEEELAGLDPDADLWTSLELDSMDHLTIMELLSDATGRDIPERDYGRLLTVSAICAYLATPDS
jgi:acyl carrier protein